jgi:hypothetical protein
MPASLDQRISEPSRTRGFFLFGASRHRSRKEGPISTSTSPGAGRTVRCSGRKCARPSRSLWRRAGRTRCASCIRASISSPSGTISGMPTPAMPACASTISCSARSSHADFGGGGRPACARLGQDPGPRAGMDRAEGRGGEAACAAGKKELTTRSAGFLARIAEPLPDPLSP